MLKQHCENINNRYGKVIINQHITMYCCFNSNVLPGLLYYYGGKTRIEKYMEYV